MTRLFALAVLASLVAACAAPVRPPAPDRPECRVPDKEPVDGGIGGTGHRRPGDCPARQADG